MAVNPSVLKDISQVVFYRNEPPSTKVLWAKPVGDGTYEFYVYYNGTWNIVTEEEGVTINISDVTGDLSTFNNDAGFITEDDIEDVIEGASAGATALQPSDIADWAKQPSKPSYTASEVGALPDTTKYAGSQSAGGAANKAVSIPFGQVDSTSTATAFTATVDGITELRDGVCVFLKNDVVTSTTNCTLNINGLGAKPMYFTNLAASRISSQFNAAHTVLFIYNSTRVEGGCWDYFVGYDSNNNDVAWIMRRSGGTYKAKEALNPNQILFTYSDDELLPTSRTRATTPTKELTTLDFDPFGAIYMSNNSAVVAQGADLDNVYIWLQKPLDIRYAFNVGTLTSNKAVYVKCSPLANGRVVLATDTQIYQELPTTEDGYVYIYLGMMQTGNLMQFTLNHPIYYFKDGAIRQWTNAVPTSKRGVVSQTQTWTGSDATGYDYTMSNLVYGEIPQANIDLFVDAGAVFNETTGYFELNGLTDISYGEMRKIYADSIGGVPFGSVRDRQFATYKQRTTVILSMPSWYGTSINFMFQASTNLEVAYVGIDGENGVNLTTVSNPFKDCKKLRRIIGTLRATSFNDTAFQNTFSLEEVRVKELKSDIKFSNSSPLTLASIVYMVNNATNTSDITITLHATAFARCQADTTEYTYNGNTYTGIIAYAAAKSITIQSA